MCRTCTSGENRLGFDGFCGQGDFEDCAVRLTAHIHYRQRFARADKRAKLPRWINQYITETASNLSTDMAIVLSKLFMRTISQNPNENQTGISLWTLQDVEQAQRRQKALAVVSNRQMGGPDHDAEEQEFGDGGLDDGTLADIDLEI